MIAWNDGYGLSFNVIFSAAMPGGVSARNPAQTAPWMMPL